MEKKYCPYCGELLVNGCDCEREVEREAAEVHEAFIEEYENRPDVQAGWAQQDLIDLRRRER